MGMTTDDKDFAQPKGKNESAAKAKNVHLSVISEGMGHDSEVTTQIYPASLETSIVDKANKMILGLL